MTQRIIHRQGNYRVETAPNVSYPYVIRGDDLSSKVYVSFNYKLNRYQVVYSNSTIEGESIVELLDNFIEFVERKDVELQVISRMDQYELITRDGMGLALRDGDKEYPFIVSGSKVYYVNYEVKLPTTELLDRVPGELFRLAVLRLKKDKRDELRYEATKVFRGRYPSWKHDEKSEELFVQGYMEAKNDA